MAVVPVHKDADMTAPGADADRSVLERIADQVDVVAPQVDGIAADLTRLYRTTIPVYAQVDARSVEQNTATVLRMVLAAWRSGAPQDSVAQIAAMARIWIDQRIPLQLVAHSVQLGARRLFREIRAAATARGVPVEEIFAMQDAVWQLANDYATAIHGVQEERAIAGAARRNDFVRGVVTGALTAAEIAREASAFDLDPRHRYRVACARWRDRPADTDVAATLRARAGSAQRAVVDVVFDGHLVALLPDCPDTIAVDVAVGVGDAALPGEVETSFRHARRALDTATRYGRTGLLGLGDLGPLPLLDAAPDAGELLEGKHLAALRERGAAGDELLRTVETYLRHDRHVDATARALFLHRNTVRYRLTRFVDVTGLDIESTNGLVLAWWLLHRERRSTEAPADQV